MRPDDVSSLAVKLDFAIGQIDRLTGEVASARSEMAAMRSEFDQSKGAVRFIKWCAGLAAAAAAVWAAMHGIKP